MTTTTATDHEYRLSTDATQTTVTATSLDAAISASQIVKGAHSWAEACETIDAIGNGAWLRADSDTAPDASALYHAAAE